MDGRINPAASVKTELEQSESSMANQTDEKEKGVASYSPGPTTVRTKHISIPVDGKTMPEAYLHRIELGTDRRVFLVKQKGQYQPVTWQEFHTAVLGVFGFLQTLNLKPGDRIAIASESRMEWVMCDIAVQCYGAVTVPIYHSNSQ
jgi:long-subunit acyl-CoA synthetase (AMP-forming)